MRINYSLRTFGITNHPKVYQKRSKKVYQHLFWAHLSLTRNSVAQISALIKHPKMSGQRGTYARRSPLARWLFSLLSIGVSFQYDDLSVFDEPVGDSLSNDCVTKNLSPAAKWQVTRHNGRGLSVSGAQDLEEQI